MYFSDTTLKAQQMNDVAVPVITLQHIESVIDSSDDLRKRQKRKLKRKLRRPRVGQAVLDEVTSRAVVAQVISIELGDDSATTQVDWDALLEFLEGLLPLIVQIINLFS